MLCNYSLLSLSDRSVSSWCLNMASCCVSSAELLTGASGNILRNARRDSVSSDRKRNTMYILQRRVTDRSIWEHTAERSPRLCVIWYRKEYDISFLLQQIVTKQGHREECYRTLTLCLWVSTHGTLLFVTQWQCISCYTFWTENCSL